MDYKTKPMKRKTARELSKILRKLFGVPPDGPFPIVFILDKIADVFKNCNYEVVDDNELDINNPCRCFQNEKGGFTIQIKNSVYYGACKNNTGACRDHITHDYS